MTQKLKNTLRTIETVGPDAEFKVTCHRPQPEALESFLDTYGYEELTYVPNDLDGFWLYRVSSKISIFSEFRIDTAKHVREQSDLQGSKEALLACYAFFLGQEVDPIGGTHPDSHIHPMVTLYRKPLEEAVDIAFDVGGMFRRENNAGVSWLSVDDVLTIFILQETANV